ncbi:alkyl hydroperoxide reductase, F52a subunit, FAD/NAD(P)-binding [uncultured Sphingopyxis sp.]|uniref:Thioredoxin reductase n=2 Tax=uncultured Sphingopyxis sp. TaxID=310581 RepID=A0A1Y5PYH9_9SPHN|nr:alkyl hydroperoxide reductase, F52a subunit, FAD/NAD(P)-binding [uncultured Sphingopyxis sp.]
MPMLDANTTAQLKSYLGNLRRPIELVASLDASPKSAEMRALVEEVAAQSDLVTARFDGDDARRPSFAIRTDDGRAEAVFAGLPMGHEFTSLILALLHVGGQARGARAGDELARGNRAAGGHLGPVHRLLHVGGHPPKEDAELLDAVRALEGDFTFETFFSLSCQNCPDVVQALNIMAALNPNIRHTAIDGALFQDEVERRKVMAVPAVFLNGEPFGQGRMDLAQIVAKLDTGAVARAAEKIAAKDPFDVLVVGGGPGGAAAAIYAARKGIRTGIVAERFGGQVLDTLGIENFVSVQHTEGPKLAAQLEAHVKDYDVDVMNVQEAAELIPGGATGLHEVKLKSGASVKGKTVILSTGARWRQMGVPGEAEYRNKGVAYCPHCDGPLFKGKRVAVIGGGNSGVEAAIDLAGLVAHVTLIEFDNQLRADAVLQTKLRSLPNVTVITSALTTEVLGNGEKVVGLRYRDRNKEEEHLVELEGIFVQIGLIPNTEWLGDAVALSDRGEIEVDARGATSQPGIFAAGDVTTVPYKQIVIAMGEGSKASLSAFDHLIRAGV